MSTQKIHVKHLFIHLYCLFWVFFYLFFKKMTQVSLSRIWVVSMGSLSPNRSLWLYLSPLFYTCFHDAHLSLIVSYQFNLLNYVHYLFVCFLNIFMSKEIHKNESRLRLLQKKKLLVKSNGFFCDREENCFFIISYCLIFWTVCYPTLDFRPYSKRS